MKKISIFYKGFEIPIMVDGLNKLIDLSTIASIFEIKLDDCLHEANTQQLINDYCASFDKRFDDEFTNKGFFVRKVDGSVWVHILVVSKLSGSIDPDFWEWLKNTVDNV